VPGRRPCQGYCEGETAVGRFLCGVYECICCPDPCYDPSWLAVADAAFFVEAARPVSQMRFRWDHGHHLIFPDRAEFFWARADGKGKGPKPNPPFLAAGSVDYHVLSLYTETAVGGFSVFTETPYRSLDPDFAPHGAGFGDLSFGTKSLLFDCELLQITFQFRTFLPTGNPRKGLGTGHVTLEPSLIVAVNLAPDWYFQGQLAEWIPLGGDPNYAGAVLHYHTSLNRVLSRPLPDVQLIGTLEFSGYSFQDGAFTDPTFGPFQQASGATYLYSGPGLRLVVCDKIDFGVGTHFALTADHFAEQLYRVEFRWRF
jgi:hypothetical protein